MLLFCSNSIHTSIFLQFISLEIISVSAFKTRLMDHSEKRKTNVNSTFVYLVNSVSYLVISTSPGLKGNNLAFTNITLSHLENIFPKKTILEPYKNILCPGSLVGRGYVYFPVVIIIVPNFIWQKVKISCCVVPYLILHNPSWALCGEKVLEAEVDGTVKKEFHNGLKSEWAELWFSRNWNLWEHQEIDTLLY